MRTLLVQNWMVSKIAWHYDGANVKTARVFMAHTHILRISLSPPLFASVQKCAIVCTFQPRLSDYFQTRFSFSRTLFSFSSLLSLTHSRSEKIGITRYSKLCHTILCALCDGNFISPLRNRVIHSVESAANAQEKRKNVGLLRFYLEERKEEKNRFVCRWVRIWAPNLCNRRNEIERNRKANQLTTSAFRSRTTHREGSGGN